MSSKCDEGMATVDVGAKKLLDGSENDGKDDEKNGGSESCRTMWCGDAANGWAPPVESCKGKERENEKAF